MKNEYVSPEFEVLKVDMIEDVLQTSPLESQIPSTIGGGGEDPNPDPLPDF